MRQLVLSLRRLLDADRLGRFSGLDGLRCLDRSLDQLFGRRLCRLCRLFWKTFLLASCRSLTRGYGVIVWTVVSLVGSLGFTGSPGLPFFGVQLGTSGTLPSTTLVGSFGSVS